MIDPKEKSILVLPMVSTTQMARIFLVLCFIKIHLFLIQLVLRLKKSKVHITLFYAPPQMRHFCAHPGEALHLLCHKLLR
jgi:hypothetical protein